MIRSFIAVDLGTAVLQALRDVQDRLRQAGGDVRWVRPEGMHVTLKFLGSVEPDRLDRVHAAVRAALADQVAFTVQIRGLATFPNLRRPRVLWAGLDGEGLAPLARCVDAALTSIGFDAEQRPFSAHVTLGRVHTLDGWAAVKEQMRTHETDHFGHSAITAVGIYQSAPQRGGSVYTLLWRVPLQTVDAGTMDNSTGRK